MQALHLRPQFADVDDHAHLLLGDSDIPWLPELDLQRAEDLTSSNCDWMVGLSPRMHAVDDADAAVKAILVQQGPVPPGSLAQCVDQLLFDMPSHNTSRSLGAAGLAGSSSSSSTGHIILAQHVVPAQPASWHSHQQQHQQQQQHQHQHQQHYQQTQQHEQQEYQQFAAAPHTFNACLGTGAHFDSSSSSSRGCMQPHAANADYAGLGAYHPVGLYDSTTSAAAAAAAGSTYTGLFPQVQSWDGVFPGHAAPATPSAYTCSFYDPPDVPAAAAAASGGAPWQPAAAAARHDLPGPAFYGLPAAGVAAVSTPAAMSGFMPAGADPSNSFSYSDSTFVLSGFHGPPQEPVTAAHAVVTYGPGSTAAQHQGPWVPAGCNTGYLRGMHVQGGTPGMQGYPCTQLPEAWQSYGQQQLVGQGSGSSVATLGHSASFSGFAAAAAAAAAAPSLDPAAAVRAPAAVANEAAAWAAGVRGTTPVLASGSVLASAPVSPSAAAGTSSSEATAGADAGATPCRKQQLQQRPQLPAAAPSSAKGPASSTAAAAKGLKQQGGGVSKARAAAKPVLLSKATKRKLRDAQEQTDKLASEDKIKELAAKQIKLRTVVDQLQETRDKAAAALAKLRDSFETMAAKNKQLREDNDDMKAQIAVLKQRADINETPAISAN